MILPPEFQIVARKLRDRQICPSDLHGHQALVAGFRLQASYRSLMARRYKSSRKANGGRWLAFWVFGELHQHFNGWRLRFWAREDQETPDVLAFPTLDGALDHKTKLIEMTRRDFESGSHRHPLDEMN